MRPISLISSRSSCAAAVLKSRTGWPIKDAPRSVTVAAYSCVEAGITATLAMLKGRRAESFLKLEGIRAWCIR